MFGLSGNDLATLARSFLAPEHITRIRDAGGQLAGLLEGVVVAVDGLPWHRLAQVRGALHDARSRQRKADVQLLRARARLLELEGAEMVPATEQDKARALAIAAERELALAEADELVALAAGDDLRMLVEWTVCAMLAGRTLTASDEPAIEASPDVGGVVKAAA